MPRVQYKCICDKCKKEIELANNENDVSLNSLKYVLCDDCYDTFTYVVEKFMNN